MTTMNPLRAHPTSPEVTAARSPQDQARIALALHRIEERATATVRYWLGFDKTVRVDHDSAALVDDQVDVTGTVTILDTPIPARIVTRSKRGRPDVYLGAEQLRIDEHLDVTRVADLIGELDPTTAA